MDTLVNHRGYMHSLEYAKDRLQGRDVTGAKNRQFPHQDCASSPL